MTYMSSTRINARLDSDLARKVEAVQTRTKKSLTEIVHESLERYCDDELRRDRDAFRILESTGFVGCADGPADLSTNYKQELTRSLQRKA